MYIFNDELEGAINSAIAYLPSGVTVTPNNPPLITVCNGKHTSQQKLGKFLSATKTQQEVKALVELYKEINGDLSSYNVKYTTDYVGVYQHDVYAIDSTCRSCMTNMTAVRVYEGDERISLLTVYKESKLVGRTLVRSDKMEFVRLYIDHNFIKTPIMRALVAREGYTEGDLEGCYLTLIEDDNGSIVCPYLDKTSSFDIDYSNQRLVICSNGEFDGSTTSGEVEIEPTCQCYHCGSNVSEEDICYIDEVDAYVCEHCLNHNYVMCDGEWYSLDECTLNESTSEYIPTDCLDKYDVSFTDDGRCYDCQDVVCIDDIYYHIDDAELLVNEDEDGNTYALHGDAIHVTGSDTLESGYYVSLQIKEQLEELQEILDALQTDMFDEKIEVELTPKEVNELIVEMNLLEKLL